MNGFASDAGLRGLEMVAQAIVEHSKAIERLARALEKDDMPLPSPLESAENRMRDRQI